VPTGPSAWAVPAVPNRTPAKTTLRIETRVVDNAQRLQVGATWLRDGSGTILRVTATKFRGGQIMGIRIPTVFDDNDAKRCAGCGQPILGTPFRVSVLDAIAREAPPSWAEQAPLNPGPYELHVEASCYAAWAQRRGFYVCRLSEVRELMRPVPLPTEPPAWGVCDARHREDHEFVPA